MATLEEVTYEAGRSALADQEAVVSGIRQLTGTLLAANALVASFLGATTVHARGLHVLSWLAMAALLTGLIAAAILLAPWRLKFAIDARGLYNGLYEQASGRRQRSSCSEPPAAPRRWGLTPSRHPSTTSSWSDR